jgi:phosphopantothenoylcysteine synthetase/decarboxylase
MAFVVVASSVGVNKACEVVRGFQRAGHDVQVIMTRDATELSRFLWDAIEDALAQDH